MKSHIIYNPKPKLNSAFYQEKKREINDEFDSKIKSTNKKAVKTIFTIQRKYQLWKLSSHQNLCLHQT